MREICAGGIQNTAPVIRNPSNDWNPEYKCHLQRIWIPVSWNTHIPRLSRIPFQGVTKAFDIALCNNGRLTLLNGSFCRKVSHIFVRYESFKVKFAAKL